MHRLITLFSILFLIKIYSITSTIVSNNDEWKEIQTIPAWMSTLCIYEDIIVTARQSKNDLSYATEEPGAFIYVKKNGLFVYDQTIATDRFVYSCTLSSNIIALSVYPIEQESNPTNFYVDIYETDDSSQSFKFVQSIAKV